MAVTIQEYVEERGIKFLVHFTKEKNLASILQRGLVPRDILALEGGVDFNDAYRHDGTSAVCLSIGFPNYKMFFSLRQTNANESWVVIGIHPSVLWTLPTAFCMSNAASATVTAVPIAQRMGLPAFQRMYEDWGEKTRPVLGIPNSYPTNPQAEVLMLKGVPRQYILGVLALNATVQQRLVALHPGLDVRVNAGFFRYRQDYAHWKQVI
ncbi:DUF4433 domain-containing protein [Pseudomonas aeruginosa]|nr:DUF4433 domain-containing protein [Pseudomonas aeruginosa]